tara:strand:- start:134 stop:778 length:645 start_codon:yes stop_codon:yes gene_type:complete
MSETIYQGEFMPSNPQFKTYSKTANKKVTNNPIYGNQISFQDFLKNIIDRSGFGSIEGRTKKYTESKKNIFGFPLPEFGLSEALNLPDLSVIKEENKNKQLEKEILERKKRRELEGVNGDESKVPSFEDVMGMGVGPYLDKIAQVGERAKDRDMIREGVTTFANFPLIGAKAALESAANIAQLTGVNMAAIANQSDVMAQNPTKQKIAGKYFRM